MLSVLWGRVGPYVLGVGAIALALLTFGKAQRRAGRAEVEAENTRQALNNVEVRREVEDDIRRAGPGSAADRLRGDWSRD